MSKIYIKNINDINIATNNISTVNTNKSYVSTMAWAYLKKILSEEYNCIINDNSLFFNEYGKPYLINNSDIYFNISHSKDMIAIIIDSKECGIDIEFINYNKDISKMSEKILSQLEKKSYFNSKDKQKYFYKIWTKKEAYYKGLGTGIRYKMLSNTNDYSNIKSLMIYNGKDKYYVSWTK